MIDRDKPNDRQRSSSQCKDEKVLAMEDINALGRRKERAMRGQTASAGLFSVAAQEKELKDVSVLWPLSHDVDSGSWSCVGGRWLRELEVTLLSFGTEFLCRAPWFRSAVQTSSLPLQWVSAANLAPKGISTHQSFVCSLGQCQRICKVFVKKKRNPVKTRITTDP